MRKNRIITLCVLVLLLTFITGCKNETEKISSLETVDSEAVSEVTSLEEIYEETYSAQNVMTLIDELISKYPYNKPEHIVVFVIAANKEYMKTEDLNVVIDAYGYNSLTDLPVLYDEFVLDNHFAFQESFAYSQGEIETLAEELSYENRITLESVMMNKEDAKKAKIYDAVLLNRSKNIVGGDEEEAWKKIRQSLLYGLEPDDFGNFEKIVYGYSLRVRLGDDYDIYFYKNPILDF